MTATARADHAALDLQTHPDRYRHWQLVVDGDVATLTMRVQQDGGQSAGYELKLNSYDLGVDLELADCVQRLQFEHPGVRCVVVTGGLDRVFCAGANIGMLSTASHFFKVNFCKFTNETRLAIEDLSARSDKRFLAALNGTASGGGYELALACDRILLVDDRNSAVSFPEVPLLGVLPGTGGLTRITDKRKVRRDRTDVFSTVAEGIKGKRAVEWNLVDALAPLSKWDETVASMARTLADSVPANDAQPVTLPALDFERDGDELRYRYVRVSVDPHLRKADVEIALPDAVGPKTADEAHAAGASWWLFQLFRELDHALVHLRLERPDVGLLLVRVVGDPEVALAADELFVASDAWFVREVRNFARRTLKRLENTAKSLYAVADEGTAFAGTFLEVALACDRTYVLDDPEAPVKLGVSAASAGAFPMANGLTRLEARFLGTPDAVGRVLEHRGATIDAQTADELGLATFAPDDIDWEDELRLAVEERASFSPDALTAMESNLRFAGAETLETKIFGRLSAWQNWIFHRPNAVGARGALKCYGTPQAPEFDYSRT